jgi:hypothetical protein
LKSSTLPVLILSLSLALSASVKGPSTGQKAKAGNLFIIVANGVRYDDAFGKKNHLYTETIWTKLRPLGTICTKFFNPDVTYPVPAQANLLAGAWHVFENPRRDTIHPVFPTMFEYWKKKEPGDNCYFASNKKSLGVTTCSNNKEYGRIYAPVVDTNTAGGTDTSSREATTDVMGNAIYKKAVSYIFQHHPSFVYVNLDSGSGDEAHLYDHECRVKDKKDDCSGAEKLNAYYESIILTDAIVYDLWGRLQRDEIYKDKSIFVFLSAHGRHTDDFHGFGDNCRGCQQLNFLIIGPGIKKDFISKTKRTLIDICPTVGTLCAIPTPYAKGKIMKEILE